MTAPAEKLFNDHRAWARTIAATLAKKLPRHIVFDDLTAAADVGLWQAAERYNPDAGASFKTFAARRVFGQIVDEMRVHGWVSLRRTDHSRLPVIVSMPQRDDDGEMVDVEFPDSRGAQGFDAIDAQDEFCNMTSGLDPDYRNAITLYYRDGLSLKETGAAMGLCESRICQMLPRAHASIKARLQLA